MMCNELNKNKTNYNNDYRFIIYRLDQIEDEEKENFKQLMQMLQLVQEGMNDQNKTIVELKQRQTALEKKIGKIDQLLVDDATHKSEIGNIYHRLNVYKAVLVGITITVIGTVALAVLKIAF